MRFVERFVPDPELAAYLRRADLVALPYRNIDQSGVLSSALAFGKPIVMSAVGGFAEVAEDHGAARLVPPEDPAALAGAINELLADGTARAALAEAAGRAAAGPLLLGPDRAADPRPLRVAPVRVVFLAKHKRSAARALEHLVERGCEVAAVVAGPVNEHTVDSQRVDVVAERHGLPQPGEEELYDGSLGEVDLVVSFLFPRLIRAPLIELPRTACLNFHPAPLPDLRGLGGLNVAILEQHGEYGVSAHHVSESFDTGDIVEVERFAIDPDRETAWSLDLKSQERLLALFERTIARLLEGEPLPREPQGEGRYVTAEEAEALRVVRPGDTPEDTARRIRAFWYPPYEGAVLELDGRRYTLLDEPLLEELGRRLREGEAP